MYEVVTKYYKVSLGGEETTVRVVKHGPHTRCFASDGTEYRDSESIKSIFSQLSKENEVNIASVNEGLLDSPKMDDAPTQQLPNRKIIPLKNGDMIVGLLPNGTQVNICMVSRFGIVDMGSSAAPFNINSSDRPTVQLPGQSGEQAQHIAYYEELQELIKRIEQLEKYIVI